MKAAMARKPFIRIAVVESDPLRFVGFRALFDSESDFELVSASLPEISTLENIDLVLLGNRSGQNLFDTMASLKATRPDLRIIVTGSGVDEDDQDKERRMNKWTTMLVAACIVNAHLLSPSAAADPYDAESVILVWEPMRPGTAYSFAANMTRKSGSVAPLQDFTVGAQFTAKNGPGVHQWVFGVASEASVRE